MADAIGGSKSLMISTKEIQSYPLPIKFPASSRLNSFELIDRPLVIFGDTRVFYLYYFGGEMEKQNKVG